ncbi:hypothetical protein ACFSC6_03240 [Rufibacter sediminis]|uniref:FlgD Ig-like domain-containing protein n=1 Tax=Rufibacter sediminis TaxID=2762756 RepID=A0ABR6VW55_9BACT|nr:hypothetical protein [Rufibacter sediminis]MBC3541170.1 hypothetical protein [Rufibacter sediminis]
MNYLHCSCWRHHVRWNGGDQRGRMLPSGLYFIFVQVGNEKDTKRVTFK